MTLIPYLAAFIAGSIGWAVGKRIEGIFTASILSLIWTGLGFYFSRKYVKDLQDMVGR